MSIEYAIFLLGCLEGIAVLAIAWILKTTTDNGKTLASLNTKVAIMCSRTKDHEQRIRKIEVSHE